MSGERRDDVVPMSELSAALDEIWRLRTALAYEAAVTRAHLSYATFPKGRRKVAEEQIVRMCQSARGCSERAYADRNWQVLVRARRDAGVAEFFTRQQWRQELPPPRPSRPVSAPQTLERTPDGATGGGETEGAEDGREGRG